VQDGRWHQDAACRGTDVELFYSEDESDERRALAVCAGCPVREPCLAQAMADREPFGVWGGTTGRRRRRIFRAARRGRRSAA
jgi:hypothetical protein